MLLQLLSGLCFVAASALLWRLLRRQPVPPPPHATDVTPERVVSARLSGSEEHWCKVLDGETLLQHCHAQASLDEILRQSRLAPDVFKRELRTALVAFAEFVQLTPASESHHHAHPGGLLAHTLEVILGATTLRNGYLLPLHAPTELIDRQRDHWVFAVFLAALLHDIGKIMTDLRLDARDSPQAPIRRWLPMSGPLTQSRATEYRIRFAPSAERDYLAHKKLALILLQAIVPPNALAFLGRENAVLEALICFLGGEGEPGSAAAEGAKTLAQIIKQADQHSVAHNLQHGPRDRFASATTVPLIERLIAAIRGMLAQGTVLPLNRDGAAGWVYDGAIWFVAKRLADTVRIAIQKEDPGEGLPGPTKNDRIFDAFQDYGVIETNPASGQAIWYVSVRGEGYAHRLSVLKFPLHRLYDDPARYPAAMQGIIEPEARNEGLAQTPAAVADSRSEEGRETIAPRDTAPSEPANESVVTTPPEPLLPSQKSRHEARPDANEPRDADLLENVDDETALSRLTPAPEASTMLPRPAPPTGGPGSPKSAKSGRGDIPAPRPPSSIKKPAPRPAAKTAPTTAAEPPTAPAVPDAAPAMAIPAAKPTDRRPPIVTARPMLPPDESGPRSMDSGLLDADDAVLATGARRSARQPVASQPASTPVAPYAVAPMLAPEKEPSALAIAFMEWVQHGLAGGSLLYNEPGAPIHFIPQGMALVSPRIFRDYALAAEANADAVQQQVIGAGWHVKASKNNNILHFSVVKRDGVRAGKLSAVVIDHPERWINPLPTANLCIVPFALSVDPAVMVGAGQHR